MAFYSNWFKSKSNEGQYRPGPYVLMDGTLSAQAGSLWNWWQSGYSLNSHSPQSSMVEACVGAYSQTVAMCLGDHWRSLPTGGRERVTTSALSRILKRPNDYQSISDLLLNLTRSLMMTGNAYGVVLRNNRGEISELHMVRNGQPRIAETGDIFYSVNGNEVFEARIDLTYPIPARDVLHCRLQTPRHPLKGESPILAAALDMATRDAVIAQQISFFANAARPSIMLRTDEKLTPEQVATLRQLWDSQTKGEGVGGTPIMTWGLKAETLNPTSEDNQVAELLKMTNESIALAFRVPLAILGVGGPTYASTELLMQQWISSGLGFTLNHIEQAFDNLFGLRGVPEEYTEFDTDSLLRSAYKERMEGLARGVISGIYSPDEARDRVGLAPAPGGHGKEPRVQQQVVPLSYGSEMKPPDNTPPPAPEATPPVEPDEDDKPDGEDDDNNESKAASVADQVYRRIALH